MNGAHAPDEGLAVYRDDTAVSEHLLQRGYGPLIVCVSEYRSEDNFVGDVEVGVGRIILNGTNDGVSVNEASDIVDVPIGVITDDAFTKPQHGFHSQIVL